MSKSKIAWCVMHCQGERGIPAPPDAFQPAWLGPRPVFSPASQSTTAIHASPGPTCDALPKPLHPRKRWCTAGVQMVDTWCSAGVRWWTTVYSCRRNAAHRPDHRTRQAERPVSDPGNKRLGDARAFAMKAKRSASKLAHWEPEILELVRLKVSYRGIQQFLAERGTSVCVNAIYKFANAHKRSALLQVAPPPPAPPAPVRRRSKAPVRIDAELGPPSSAHQSPGAERLAPASPQPATSPVQRTPSEAATSPPPGPPTPGSLPRLAWNPHDIDMKDLK